MMCTKLGKEVVSNRTHSINGSHFAPYNFTSIVIFFVCTVIHIFFNIPTNIPKRKKTHSVIQMEMKWESLSSFIVYFSNVNNFSSAHEIFLNIKWARHSERLILFIYREKKTNACSFEKRGRNVNRYHHRNGLQTQISYTKELVTISECESIKTIWMNNNISFRVEFVAIRFHNYDVYLRCSFATCFCFWF